MFLTSPFIDQRLHLKPQSRGQLVHHAGSHGLHVLLHLFHVVNHRLPQIHIVPPTR